MIFFRENYLSSLDEDRGFIKILWAGMHQANLLIAKLHSPNDPSIIVGNNADFMMLVGIKSAQITSFTHSLKSSKISNINLMLSRK